MYYVGTLIFLDHWLDVISGQKKGCSQSDKPYFCIFTLYSPQEGRHKNLTIRRESSSIDSVLSLESVMKCSFVLCIPTLPFPAPMREWILCISNPDSHLG